MLLADPGPSRPAAARSGTAAFLGIDSMQSVSMGTIAGCGVQGSASFTLHSNGFGASQRLVSLTTYRSLTLTRNGLMLRGIFGLLALMFDLPSIFLALVLDCLSVTLSLLCHTHNRLLSGLGHPTPLDGPCSQKKRLAASIRSSFSSTPDPSQTLRMITVSLLSPHGYAHPSRADASGPSARTRSAQSAHPPP